MRFTFGAETMVHSSFTPLPSSDFTLSIVVDNAPLTVDVVVRPWLHHFLQQVAKHYEVVIFTASLAR
jgi:carboxy-terminal domain RNA polymerase II polypeptide A small phosphatase